MKEGLIVTFQVNSPTPFQVNSPTYQEMNSPGIWHPIGNV